MSALILRSLVVAIIVGMCVSLATTAIGTRVSCRYEPGLTQSEMQQLSQLTPAQAEAAAAGRRKPYSRREWLIDSLGEGHFWRYLAQRSVVPAIGIFFGCVFVGALTRRDTLRHGLSQNQRHNQTPYPFRAVFGVAPR
jgi:hypothetical protein